MATRYLNSEKNICFLDLSLMDYQKALSIQHMIHKQCVEKKIPGCIIFVEHPDVITLGKHCSDSDYILEKKLIEQLKIPIVRTDRGGKITAHSPGQLTIYPILNLVDHIFPKELVSFLQTSTIKVLANFGLSCNTDSFYPGVWISNDKIAAIGLRIKDRVSYHGISVNISNELKLFSYILPCGISGRGVTSLKKEISKKCLNNCCYNSTTDDNIVFNEVKKSFKAEFESRLGPLKTIKLSQILQEANQ